MKKGSKHAHGVLETTEVLESRIKHFLLMVLVAIPVITGVDVGRFHWSHLDFLFMILGFLLFIISTVLINWAVIANPYFEPFESRRIEVIR